MTNKPSLLHVLFLPTLTVPVFTCAGLGKHLSPALAAAGHRAGTFARRFPDAVRVPLTLCFSLERDHFTAFLKGMISPLID